MSLGAQRLLQHARNLKEGKYQSDPRFEGMCDQTRTAENRLSFGAAHVL